MKVVTLSFSKLLNGTQTENKLIKIAQKAFPLPDWSVVCLNSFPPVVPFEFYENIVSNSDSLVLTEYLNYIGYGQFTLLRHGLSLRKPISVFREIDSNYELFAVKGFELVCHDLRVEFAKIIIEE